MSGTLIFLLKKKGLTNTEIAVKLGRNKSTIDREVRRNTHQKLQQYLPDTAERKAPKRRIIRLLKGGWSPDLIAGRLKRANRLGLNQESIYQFIYSLAGWKQNLRQYLERTETPVKESYPQSCRHHETA